MKGESTSADPAVQVNQSSTHWMGQSPLQAVLEFSRDRKSMSTLCGYNSGAAEEVRAISLLL